MKKILPILFFILLSYMSYAWNTYAEFELAGAFNASDPISAMDIGDLDNDGDFDIVTTGAGAAQNVTLRWYENTGGYSFIYHSLTNISGADNVQIIDVDGDGYNDILAAFSSIDTVTWYENDGDKTFTPHNISTDENLVAYILGIDIDGDGDIDVISASTNENDVHLFKNNGAEVFTESDVDSSTIEPNILEAGDLDNDGDIDIIAATDNSPNYKMYWYENNGNEVFTEHNIASAAGLNYHDIDIVDFDDDGYMDIAAAAGGSNATNRLRIYLNDGNEDFTTIKQINANGIARQIEVYDYDNDGFNDVLGAGSATIYTSLYDYEQGLFQSQAFTSSISTALLDYDLNDDGILDFVTETDEMIFNFFINSEDILLSCPHPQIFCDNFNYNSPMQSRFDDIGWIVYNSNHDTNSTFSPDNDVLNLTEQNESKSFLHSNDKFITDYAVAQNVEIASSYFSPVFGSEFRIKFLNASKKNSDFVYWVLDIHSDSLAYIVFNKTSAEAGGYVDMYYQSSDAAAGFVELCSNCFQTDIWVKFKMLSFFKDNDNFDFNSSITNNHIILYLNNEELEEITFMDNNSDNSKIYYMLKKANSSVLIDDYYVYIGTDKNIDTTEYYYTDIWEEPSVSENVTYKPGTGDFADAVFSIWDDFGLKSTTSRVMVALFLMFVLAILIIGMSVAHGSPINPTAIILAELFLMILFVYIKLLPIWIPIVLGLLAAGVGALRAATIMSGNNTE